MCKFFCTFAPDFILRYCAYTRTGTYNDGDFPTLLDGSVGGGQYTKRRVQHHAGKAGHNRITDRFSKYRHRTTEKEKCAVGAGALPIERLDGDDGKRNGVPAW